jgi:hypothetical protein
MKLALFMPAEFPKIGYAGSSVSENAPSREFVNKGVVTNLGRGAGDRHTF